MCHKLEFLLPIESGAVLLFFPRVESSVNLCLVVCHCEEFTKDGGGGGEETFFLSFFFIHINTVITMLLSKFVINSLIVLTLN